MIVVFGNCTDDPRKLDKTINTVFTAQCNVYGSCSIIKPVLTLRYDPLIKNCNYCYIQEWGRYYTIGEPTVDNGKQMYINATVDALYSFAEDIKNCSATCIRNEGIGAPTYVPDSSFPIMPAGEYLTSTIIGQYFEPGTGSRYFLLATK